MLQLFPKAGILALIAAFVLLTLAVACATAATPTPVSTDTPVPTATPTLTATLTPTPAPVPTATFTPVPTATSVPTPDVPDVGQWVFDEIIDAISDARSVGIKLKATESDGDTLPNIWVTCFANRNAPIVRLHIDWGEFLGSDNPEIAWRVDNNTASSKIWRLDGSSLVAPLPDVTWRSGEMVVKDVDPFIKDLRSADKITARVHFYLIRSPESITAIWHPVGFAEAYKPVAAACNLTIP